MEEDELKGEIPTSLRQLRACLTCHLILTTKQWNGGCPNCRWGEEQTSRTTPSFKGMLAMMQPKTSWVARWQKQDNAIPGLYAMQVVGKRAPREEE